MSNAGFVVTERRRRRVRRARNTGARPRDDRRDPQGDAAADHARVVVSHYHADHVYGLQPLKDAGAEIWAYRKGEAYFTSGLAEERLAQRRVDLYPWVDETTRVVAPDLWLDGDADFRMGGLTFRLVYSGGGHSPEDLMMYVVEDRLLYAGDLIFAGRIPFVGNADSRGWLEATERMLALAPAVVVPGHGPVSRDVARDLTLTRDYLIYLRETMGRAVDDLDAVRRRVFEDRLVTLRAAAGVRAGEPDQRVGHVPADGAGGVAAREVVAACGAAGQGVECTRA